MVYSSIFRFPEAFLGWKIEGPSRVKDLSSFKKTLDEHGFPNNRVFRVLLHNYAGKKSYVKFQSLVDQIFGKDLMPIGVCNITASQLEDLVNDTPKDTNHKEDVQHKETIRVNYVQNEYHPFLKTEVPSICQKYGVQFEAHSTMWGNLEDYESVLRTILSQHDNKLILPQKISPLSIAFAGNAFTDIGVEQNLPVREQDTVPSICFTTTNYAHLADICNTKDISTQMLKLMRNMCNYKRVVRYKGSATTINTDWITSCDVEYMKWKIVPQLKIDIKAFNEGKVPSELCWLIPKRYQKAKVHSTLAEMLYLEYLQEELTSEEDTKHLFGKRRLNRNESFNGRDWLELDSLDIDSANQRFSGILKKMRKRVEDFRIEGKRTKKVATCALKAVTNPEALAVDYFPDASEFVDLNRYIIEISKIRKQLSSQLVSKITHFRDIKFKYGSLHNVEQEKANEDPNPGSSSNIRFEHGTLNSDGPLDLCKQGVKNAYIENCEAVITDGTEINARFEHGTLNSDGRLDLCKQGVKNAYIENCEAVITDGDIKADSSSNIRFKHGTLNDDGRLDLCKQGVKNAYIESCNAVNTDSPNNSTSLIKHYLLGNNVIGDNSDGQANARIAALCEMIKKRPDIITWYLAGNALSENYIELVADALQNSRAKYIWFKMNPIKNGCHALARLIQHNPSIELLDLFNCGIGDTGLMAFCSALIEIGQSKLLGIKDDHADLNNANSIIETITLVSETLKNNKEILVEQNDLVPSFRALNFSNLRHIYFGINNITESGMTGPLFCIFAVLSSKLESIYIHSNPIKDVGLKRFFDKMIAYGVTFPNLKRICLGSCSLTDVSLPTLVEFIKRSPRLISLDLSSYKSTNYFALQHNTFTDMKALYEIAIHLKSNAITSGNPDRNYIGFQHALCNCNPAEVTDLVKDMVDNLEINVNGIQYKNNDVIQGGMFIHKKLTKRQLSEVSNPYPAIDYIRSIYRNNMKL